MSMLLSPEDAKRRNVPKEYNMHVTNQESINTFLFSEKDLPGFKSFAQNQHYSRTDAFMGKNRVGKNKKPFVDFRRTVPSQPCIPYPLKTYMLTLCRRTNVVAGPSPNGSQLPSSGESGIPAHHGGTHKTSPQA